MESFETFRTIRAHERVNFIQKYPSSFNREVRAIKYKITVEQIDEPLDVIQSRIQKLWNRCDNWRDKPPLLAAAKKYNMSLE